MDVRYFKSIKVCPPVKRIYSRLGYQWGKTKLNPRQEKMLESGIEEGISLIDIKGAARILKINNLDVEKVTLSAGLIFKSKSLSIFLKDYRQALIIGVTAGSHIVKRIKDLSKSKELTKAVILDAFASETVDEGLTWIMNLYRHELSRQSQLVSKRRFSAGYGDLLLENQKAIYNILDMSVLGVKITSSFLLKPEKSVTAISGIKKV